MPWYAAHAVMYFQHTDGPQDGYWAQENVFLVRADSPDEARDKGRDLASREAGDNRGSLLVNDRPATLVFGTVRKVVSVLHAGPDDHLGDGDELTYSEYRVDDRAALNRLIRAEDADVVYLGKPDGEPTGTGDG